MAGASRRAVRRRKLGGETGRDRPRSDRRPCPDRRRAEGGRMIRTLVALSLLLAPLPAVAQPSDPYAPESFEGVRHPDWSRNAVIYQVNTRQFTPEGTLKAAAAGDPAAEGAGRRHPVADADPPDRREEPQGDAGQSLLDPRLSRGKPGTGDDGRFEGLRRRRPCQRHEGDPRLGRQPHRLGPSLGDSAPGMVRPRLEGRPCLDALVGLVRHYRPRLLPHCPSPRDGRFDGLLGSRGRY